VKPQPSAPCAFEVEYLEIQNQDRDRATIESLSNDLAARKELYVTSYDRDLVSVTSLAAKRDDRPPNARVHTPAVIRRDRSRIHITDQEHVTERLACLMPRSFQTSLQSIWVSCDLIRAIHPTCA
jgi:hypothetical protein